MSGEARGARPPGTVVIRRVLPATREEVFAAWTDVESMREWMCPSDGHTAEAQLDPRVGGSYRIVMRDRAGVYEHTGEYLLVEPPAKLVFTWIAKSTNNRPTIVTVELFPHERGCELVLTHERLPEGEIEERHRGGWEHIADRLAAHLVRRQTDGEGRRA
ncbi:MAG TPA: SRPBCC domain-containing protein [bacterium]|nr:SRPBCC domain-containing protein [bacterium]